MTIDVIVLAFVAIQGIALAFLAAQSMGRGHELERIAAIFRPDPVSDGPGGTAGLVLSLKERADSLAWMLEQQRNDTAYLAELMSVGIVHLDDELHVDQANAAAHLFLDREPGSMLGHTAIEAFVDTRIEAIVTAARDGGAGHGEVSLGGPDGRALVVRARRSPIRGVWVVLEDVAELRRLQRIRAEFIDNLSHELRTPLSALALLAETLMRDAEAAGSGLTPRMRDRIGKIEVETGHLTQMVTELLDLSRIEREGSQLHLDDVDLGAVAAASVERLRLFAERHGVELRVERPEGPAAVRGDADRLAQVFVNLLHNAVKFSQGGGTVTVRILPGDQEIVAAIKDQGSGIAPTDLDRIFERFYKADRARVRGGGTGLGLSIARHIVESHSGRIWAESIEGDGSTFSFALPAAPRTDDLRRPGSRIAGPSRGTANAAADSPV
jgi:two-component system phosphate regulon sensor histidine kinase PhoR